MIEGNIEKLDFVRNLDIGIDFKAIKTNFSVDLTI